MSPRRTRFPAPHSRTVIVVSSLRRHFEATRQALRRLAPGWRTEWIRDSADAMRLSLSARAEVMVVDRNGCDALLRHLAYWRPDVSVLAFDEHAMEQDDWPRHVGNWSDLGAELETMLESIETRDAPLPRARVRPPQTGGAMAR